MQHAGRVAGVAYAFALDQALVLAVDHVHELRLVERLEALPAAPFAVQLIKVLAQARGEQRRGAFAREALDVTALEGQHKAARAVQALVDQLALGVGHRRLAGGAKVAQVQVQQVVVQRCHAAVVDFSFQAGVEIGAEFFWRVDDGVAAVVLLEHHGHGLVAEEHHVDVVALVIRRHVLGVDADPLPGDEGLELVLDVVKIRAGDHFVGDQEQAARRPIVELVLDG